MRTPNPCRNQCVLKSNRHPHRPLVLSQAQVVFKIEKNAQLANGPGPKFRARAVIFLRYPVWSCLMTSFHSGGWKLPCIPPES